jgi:hypothetical protein
VLAVRSYAKSSSTPSSATVLAARRPAITTVLKGQYSAEVSPSVLPAEVNPEGFTKGEGNLVDANIADGTVKVADMFGENRPRLKEIKRKYDSNFVFNMWYPVPLVVILDLLPLQIPRGSSTSSQMANDHCSVFKPPHTAISSAY